MAGLCWFASILCLAKLGLSGFSLIERGGELMTCGLMVLGIEPCFLDALSRSILFGFI